MRTADVRRNDNLRAEALRLACALMVEGAQASDQPRHTRWWLKGLEATGHAEYLGANGWVLTPDGRRAATEHFLHSRKQAKR